MILTHRIENNVCIIDIEGEIVFDNDPGQLLLYVTDMLQTGFAGVVVNLKQVTSIDSSGVASLVSVFRNLETRQLSFAICQLGNNLEIIKLAGLYGKLPIFEAEQAALESIQ